MVWLYWRGRDRSGTNWVGAAVSDWIEQEGSGSNRNVLDRLNRRGTNWNDTDRIGLDGIGLAVLDWIESKPDRMGAYRLNRRAQEGIGWG